MKVYIKAGCLLLPLFISVFTFSSFFTESAEADKLIHAYFKEHSDAISRNLSSSEVLLQSDQIDKKELTEHYLAAREHYKKIECLIEYYYSFEAKYFINGPPIRKAEIEYSLRVFEPHGFQFIEELLFSKNKTPEKAVLLNEYKLMNETFRLISKRFEQITVKEEYIPELLQLHTIRVMSLYLNGYDATQSKNNISETACILNGFRDIIRVLQKDNPSEVLSFCKQITIACDYLKNNSDYDSFDRMYFITEHLNPLYAQLAGLHQKLTKSNTHEKYALNLKAPSLFDITAINNRFFVADVSQQHLSSEQAALGKYLFFDPILSGDNKRACASCHNPSKGFTDGQPKSIGFEHAQGANRNAPTLLNVAYQKAFFYDGRLLDLEQQITEVLGNKNEMNSSGKAVIEKLKESTEYRTLFKKAFHGTRDTAITSAAVAKAIAAYERTLVSLNSRFDKYLRGDKKQMSKEEIKGYNLFAGKALCGSCHFFPLFNGTVPPMYSDNDFEIIGVPQQQNGKIIDPDTGRQHTTKSAVHRFAFKTPGIRNVELTAPYMHNGAFAKLDDVLEFYNNGGGIGNGIALDNQTLPSDSLKLSKTELENIKAFMLTLTDTASLTTKPARLPGFPKTEWNKRVIGGEY